MLWVLIDAQKQKKLFITESDFAGRIRYNRYHAGVGSAPIIVAVLGIKNCSTSLQYKAITFCLLMLVMPILVRCLRVGLPYGPSLFQILVLGRQQQNGHLGLYLVDWLEILMVECVLSWQEVA